MSPHHLLELVATLAVTGVAIPAAVLTRRQVIDRRDARTTEAHKPKHALIAPWDDPSLLDMWAQINSTFVDATYNATPWLYEAADEADALSPDLTYTAFTRRSTNALNALLEATDEQLALPAGTRAA